MSPLSVNHNLMAYGVSRQLSAHYDTLADSVRRLSTGLRVERAADDATGLAIRELMRADIKALGQGARNANDAISLIQTADGALQIIDEKLIRMKELAEQAATGTYDSTQRLIINSEFQQMASEIDRIAKATDFNGVKLLDGSLSGRHDGTGAGSADGLSSTGALKVHFGTANDSAEDYYYVEIGDCTLAGLGLREGGAAGGGGVGGGGAGYGGVPILSERVQNGKVVEYNSGFISFGIIPAGSTNISLYLNDGAQPDDILIFNRKGELLAGNPMNQWSYIPVGSEYSESNGFLPGAVYDSHKVNGTGTFLNYVSSNYLYNFTVDGMNFGYTGSTKDFNPNTRDPVEKLTIDYVTEDLVLVVAGIGVFNFSASWTAMPTAGGGGVVPPGDPNGDIISISTQELAQRALNRLDNAIVRKDQIRAHLGATQNRLENTVTNLNVQAESLQAAESRISDVDVATEMTTFVRNQVLTQSATSMLAQANAFPHMLLQLLQG